MIAPVPAFVGLGGNLGPAADALRAALAALDALPGTRVLRASRLYRTPAWGYEDQPDFINAVAMLDTGLGPRALLDALLAVERSFGRERDVTVARWGPRTLDLDLLLHGDATVEEAGLHLPHPQLLRRAFVLVPLAEIAPEAVIPGHGRVREALAALPQADVAAISVIDG